MLGQRKFLVAYSGGLDSHVLLHVMSQIPDISLRAVYIDHGLQESSLWWGRHCRGICSDLSVPFQLIPLNLQVPSGESLEAYARDKRYQAFAGLLEEGEVLLTGHHQNDQAETLLIQLMRGAGGAGLSAMPMITSFSGGHLMRPFLNFHRSALEDYAAKYQLDFVEDESNADLRYDRNYLRHQILPQLEDRWPGCYGTLARAALLQGETQRLLDGYLSEDMTSMTGSVVGTLSVKALKQCESARQRALLRLWITTSGFIAPSAKKLQHVVSDALFCSEEASPCVHWGSVEVRRFRDDLYAMEALSEHDESQSFYWDELSEDLPVESLGLSLQSSLLGGWRALAQQEEIGLTVKFRQGGESIKPSGRDKSISLKNLFQQLAVPPWMRSRMPLIYFKDDLIMVYGLCQVELD
ncbi:tRNA lysidine(34) synthetase TilS [Leucothrix arctica]|uniref:tRNA lysidine(34) synthetase TilS n=1 Tax=Leucothrix arctica TaxID=1481894 RepID=UPI002482CAEE|nr:tRNA lysidine(34) synthetase TilS [Leucothrix arctica]